MESTTENRLQAGTAAWESQSGYAGGGRETGGLSVGGEQIRPAAQSRKVLEFGFDSPYTQGMPEFDWDVNAADKRVLPAILYLHFSKAIARNRDLLETAKLDGSLDNVAWLARNILELRVWAEYCSQSQQHVEEFFQDAIRDVHDLQMKVGGLDRKGVEQLQKATKFIGTSKKAHEFKDVRIAAREVRLGKLFKQNNKILSKFAHPTALSLLGGFQVQNADQIRMHVAEIGLNMAAEALKTLDASLLGRTYRKYQATIGNVLQSLPENNRPF